MDIDEAVDAVQEAYPQIYLACHTRHDRRSTNPDGLSRRDSQVLQHLDADPPIRAGELATHLGIGAPALSAAIDRLEQRGLAERRRVAEDRRKVEVLLTAAGRRVKRSASVLEAGLVGEMLDRLQPAEREDAVRGLQLLQRAAAQLMEEKRNEGEKA